MSPAAPRPVLTPVPAGAVGPGTVAGPARVVCISVQNSMVAAALTVTAQRQGWITRSAPASGTVLVTDELPRPDHDRPSAAAVLLVIEPSPFSARRAIDALAALEVTSVVCADEPDDLDAALSCLIEDRASLPRRVLELAARMPQVNGRQIGLLGAVLAGQTTAQMARGLSLSPASVKRELSSLCTTLGVSSRPALFARALELGVRPEPLQR